MDEMLRQLAVNALGMTEEDLAKITPEREGAFKNLLLNIGRYRLVAEVVSAQYCAAGLQAGQRFVVENGRRLNGAQSTAPLCVGALAPLAEATGLLLDRIYHDAPVCTPMVGFHCHDPGIDLGGLGHVVFKVHVEEIG